MKDVYIVGAVRTAVGSFGGSLKDTPVVEMGAVVIKEALKRAGVKPGDVEEVIMGNVLTTALGQNPARQASMKAGLDQIIPAWTVGMVCGSGMKSCIEAVRSIQSGDADIIVAGGMENMSAAPYAVPSVRWGARMGNSGIEDTMIKDGLWDAFNNYHMGITAENVAEKYGITRDELDKFAAESQRRASAAVESGRFNDEIVAVPVKVKKEVVDFKVDEYVKAGTTAEKLAGLKPAFKKDGMVTAGNASGINDGAAAMVFVSGEKLKELGLKPIAKFVSYGQAGVDPAIMGIGPVDATKNALKKAGWTVSDLDLVEANEAFAAQSLAVAKELSLDMNKVNVNGGAIAIGHPIGASGARVMVTLLYEMKKRNAKKGLATLCIGGGMGVAFAVELC